MAHAYRAMISNEERELMEKFKYFKIVEANDEGIFYTKNGEEVNVDKGELGIIGLNKYIALFQKNFLIDLDDDMEIEEKFDTGGLANWLSGWIIGAFETDKFGVSREDIYSVLVRALVHIGFDEVGVEDEEEISGIPS